ncbi:hypothetical protein [Candidatus Chlamydia sanziniae]|nr:hypothetical protein [Candidatus Chlamydia sanziniae]
MYVLSKRLYQWVNRPTQLAFLIRRLQSFSAEWVIVAALLLMLGGLGCSVLSNVRLIPILLLFSSLALPAILSFQHRGYIVVSGIFLSIYCPKYVIGLSLSSGFWSAGLGSAFLLAWGLCLQGILLVREENVEKEQLYIRVCQELDKLRGIYEHTVEDKDHEKKMLETKLQEYQMQLREACKKQEHITMDLKILSDQKNSWLEDYAVLHNKYVRLISGDESVVFPWVSEQSVFQEPAVNLQDNELWVQALQEKEEGMARLQNELAVEKQERYQYQQRCEELSTSLPNLSDLQEQLKNYQELLQQKERELLELHCLVDEHIKKTPAAASSLIEEEKRYKGLYYQLHQQFAEKNATLSSVRKELFIVREQYLTLKKKEQTDFKDITFEDICVMQKLLFYIECLEEEISCLEELVSHNLCLK